MRFESTIIMTTLDELPNELIDKIFRFMSFESIAKYRIVCKRFNEIGSSILNSEFQNLRNYTQQRFQSIKAQMPRRESARRKHPLARESDIIETLHMRLTLLQMTFSKHIERMHCCFFAGEILDEVHRIMNYVKQTPNLSRAYKVTDELFDLSTMAMEYFKEHIEPTLPEINYFGVADYFLDYSPTLTGSPQTQLSLMESTPNDMRSHQTSQSNANKKKISKQNICSDSNINRKNESIVIKRRLKHLEINVKRTNGQMFILKRELRISKKKLAQQQRVSHNLRSRFDEYDKKFENTNRKLSAVLEELSKCKTELQYWRSKSPNIANSSIMTASISRSVCRCDDRHNQILTQSEDASQLQSQSVPQLFQPIIDTIASNESNDEWNRNERSQHSQTTINHNHVIPKQCKRKLNYFYENKSKLKK